MPTFSRTTTSPPPAEERETLADVRRELAWLRSSHEDLARRVRRLEARSGQGPAHPLEYTDVSAGDGG